ncbi:DUF3794 domain-containing protein [Clostridiaceae bacterium UIB06]|uniref:DUF3794 domain-containing protein n=1 Tax=Clostridium thailandense TaxID=2794346 RepID=A0A949TIQ6_9CLOT|nr:SPOCS domain-containing protein [Clostridium thailandense]MBV7273015.1 DUF3794 domain-containing protein [Clostridium thailandense]MCH5135679.1 DUF3794 domain-containing protein [Clostridiaceae bacterium UIB06]
MSCKTNLIPPQYQPECESKKLIQVPKIIGFGKKQEFVVRELTISPPSPAVFRIEDIDKIVVITDFKLIPLNTNNYGRKVCDKFFGKVIIDGYVDKNINYKTITDFTGTDVNGPLYHFTTRVDFATFVEVVATEPIKETDNVEILSAFVEGEKEELLNPNSVPVGAPSWAVTYNSILEKMIIGIELKVTRSEHIYC